MKLKKGVKRKLYLFSILLILVIAFFCYQMFFKQNKETKKVKIASEIKEYGYILNDDESSAYHKMFYKLKSILEENPVEEEKYVKQIAMMFVYDFFTLSDKVAKTDIGGKMFVHEKALTTFLDKAEDTMYKYIENDLYGTRKQILPTVDEIEVEKVENIEFPYEETTDDKAYQVTISWSYKENLGYQDSAKLIFVHENKKLSLVEME